MRVEHIYRYPVKGLSAEALAEVHLDPGETLPGDRKFALAHGDAPFDEASPAWLQKQHFATLMGLLRCTRPGTTGARCWCCARPTARR